MSTHEFAMEHDNGEPPRTDAERRLTAHDTQLAIISKRLHDVEDKQDQALMTLGDVKTMIEKDQKERRSFEWLKPWVRLGVLAWIALAAVEVWSKLHG